LPWKNVRPKYEGIIAKIKKKYPLHFTIVGRAGRWLGCTKPFRNNQGANFFIQLCHLRCYGRQRQRLTRIRICRRHRSLGAIFLSAHKAAQKQSAGSPIISDLLGMRRVQYETDKTLTAELQKLCRDHDYTKRFEKVLRFALKGMSKGRKKRGRALALKLVHALDNKTRMRRSELVQSLQAQG
jgi:hypothetical protein